jgi:peptidoglycan biosynthesis protein MviN/MurJ (putative lipid II flippase)
MPTSTMLGSFLRMIIAAAALAAVCVLGRQYLGEWLVSPSLVDRLWSLLSVIAVGAGVYFGVCALLRVDEAHEAIALIKRKISRRGIASPGA